MKHVIGIDIGGTKIAGGILRMDAEGYHLDDVRRVSTPPGPDNILQATIDLCHDLLRGGATVQAVGIGAAGQIDTGRGVVTYAVETIPGWTGTPIQDRVQAQIGLPVFVDNDVNVMALAETHFGAGRPYRHMLLLTVGTGIGGALVLDRRLWRGTHWNAGEIGHILVDWRSQRICTCGARGHLEACAAGPAIAAHYAELAGLDSAPDLREVGQQAAARNPHAQTAIRQGAQILGAALAGLTNTLDPQAIIIGGGVPNLSEVWWGPLRESFAAGVFSPLQQLPLLPAELGEQATMIGAAQLAWEQIES